MVVVWLVKAMLVKDLAEETVAKASVHESVRLSGREGSGTPVEEAEGTYAEAVVSPYQFTAIELADASERAIVEAPML